MPATAHTLPASVHGGEMEKEEGGGGGRKKGHGSLRRGRKASLGRRLSLHHCRHLPCYLHTCTFYTPKSWEGRR